MPISLLTTEAIPLPMSITERADAPSRVVSPLELDAGMTAAPHSCGSRPARGNGPRLESQLGVPRRARDGLLRGDRRGPPPPVVTYSINCRRSTSGETTVQRSPYSI